MSPTCTTLVVSMKRACMCMAAMGNLPHPARLDKSCARPRRKLPVYSILFCLSFAMKSSPTLMVSISGVRGVVGSSLTPPVVERFVSAFGRFQCGPGAEFAQGAKLVVGRDSRVSGPWIQQLVHSLLISQGYEVVDVGVVPTPTVRPPRNTHTDLRCVCECVSCVWVYLCVCAMWVCASGAIHGAKSGSCGRHSRHLFP